MNEHQTRAGVVYNTIISLALTTSLGLAAWSVNTLIAHGQQLIVHGTLIKAQDDRLGNIELRGSRGLETHVLADDSRVADLKERVAKLETALINLQTVPGKVDAIRDTQREMQVQLQKLVDNRGMK